MDELPSLNNTGSHRATRSDEENDNFPSSTPDSSPLVEQSSILSNEEDSMFTSTTEITPIRKNARSSISGASPALQRTDWINSTGPSSSPVARNPYQHPFITSLEAAGPAQVGAADSRLRHDTYYPDTSHLLQSLSSLRLGEPDKSPSQELASSPGRYVHQDKNLGLATHLREATNTEHVRDLRERLLRQDEPEISHDVLRYYQRQAELQHVYPNSHARRPSTLMPVIREAQHLAESRRLAAEQSQQLWSAFQTRDGMKSPAYHETARPFVSPSTTPTRTFLDTIQESGSSTYPAPATREFRPMDALRMYPGVQPPMRNPGDAGMDPTLFSTSYHGMHSRVNASAARIPNADNCALWLTNLHPEVTYRELLQAINNIGRIWCTYINEPDNKRHRTAAAKVVFFNPEAAQRLLTLSWVTGLEIRGYRVRVAHNRIKYERNVPVNGASRVLIVTGQAAFVNEASLTHYFMSKFVFQQDEFRVLIDTGERAVVEYRFGSYRCQAQMGKMALERDQPPGFEKVEFGDDPCEHGETFASYGIAAERIRGWGL